MVLGDEICSLIAASSLVMSLSSSCSIKKKCWFSTSLKTDHRSSSNHKTVIGWGREMWWSGHGEHSHFWMSVQWCFWPTALIWRWLKVWRLQTGGPETADSAEHWGSSQQHHSLQLGKAQNTNQPCSFGHFCLSDTSWTSVLSNNTNSLNTNIKELDAEKREMFTPLKLAAGSIANTSTFPKKVHYVGFKAST